MEKDRYSEVVANERMTKLRDKYSMLSQNILQLLRNPRYQPPPTALDGQVPKIIKLARKEDIDCSHIQEIVNSSGGILLEHCEHKPAAFGLGRVLHNFFEGWAKFKTQPLQWSTPRGNTYMFKVKDKKGTPISDNTDICRGRITRDNQGKKLFVFPGCKDVPRETLCEFDIDKLKNINTVYTNHYKAKHEPISSREIFFSYQKNNHDARQPVFIQVRELRKFKDLIPTLNHRRGCSCPPQRRLAPVEEMDEEDEDMEQSEDSDSDSDSDSDMQQEESGSSSDDE